nr:30S ribosome-binding factor RbfA [uncultured Carboxylicivirga sp.]
MDSTRQKKISRLLQKEISELFQKEVKELVMGVMVTVTVVRISPDLGQAKIYLSIFPSTNIDDVFNNIVENTHQIRFALGKRVGKQMRIIPDLKFFKDDSLDYLDNIDRLLKE